MLTCKECGLEKDPSLFYESNKARCKECVKSSTKKNRELKKEYYKEYDRNRPNREERNKKNCERNRRLYAEDGEFKLKRDAQMRKFREQNPNKYKAHCCVNNAIRDGKISKV